MELDILPISNVEYVQIGLSEIQRRRYDLSFQSILTVGCDEWIPAQEGRRCIRNEGHTGNHVCGYNERYQYNAIVWNGRDFWELDYHLWT